MSTPAPSAGPQPHDFTARYTRHERARGVVGQSEKRHIRTRLAVLAAAIAVPAMATPGDWQTPAATPAITAPMAFETPGESFPGSAFYYLVDEPYQPPAAAAHNSATDAGLALPAVGARQLAPGPVARSLFVSAGGMSYSRALKCMTMAIYYEAATEPDAGQRAVAQVVLNRVAHPSYPDTICGVVFHGSERTTGCQFSFTCDGALARQPAPMWWNRAEKVARAALAGAVYAPVGLATHYHTTQVHPYWADSLHTVGTIGAHIFYRWRGAAGQPSAFTDRYLGGEPVPAPAPRPAAAAANPVEADPLALAKAFEAGLRSAGAASDAPAKPAAAAPVYAAPVQARGGEALFRINSEPTSGQVREEYARSGQWLKEP